MAQIAKVIKQKNHNSIICFIGPCTAKKMEIRLDSVKKYVDYALTFVELRAMIAAKNIDLVNLKGIALDDATAFGRGFAACGGLSNAVVEVLKEIGETKFKLCGQQCSGMKQCVDAITNLANGKSNYNFIEGMACEGGCVNGAGSLTHNALVSKALIGMHSKTAKEKKVAEVTKKYIDE
jgi:iron only hydrogenase large subunit-like protein